MFRWVVGGRVDRFDYIDNFVFSPRTTFMIKPEENQTIRISYNRAYRSPSVINNHINLIISEPLDLRPLGGPAALLAAGQRRRQSGSEGAVARRRSSLATRRRSCRAGRFSPRRSTRTGSRTRSCSRRMAIYSAAAPPSNWPLPAVFIAALAAPGPHAPEPLHLQELRREHDAGPRARRERGRQSLPHGLRELLVPDRSRIRRTSR